LRSACPATDTQWGHSSGGIPRGDVMPPGTGSGIVVGETRSRLRDSGYRPLVGIYATRIAEAMSDEALHRALRPDNPLLHSVLVEVEPSLIPLRRILLALDRQPEDELPDAVWQMFAQLVEGVTSTLGDSAAIADNNPNGATAAESVRNRILEHSRQAREIRIHIVDSAVDLGTAAAEVEDLRTRTSDTLEAAGKALSEVADLSQKLETLSGAVGAGKLEKFFGEAATRYRYYAFRWLFASCITKDSPWQEVARDFVIRASVLAAIGYVLALCVRSYRANTHLAVMAEQKRTALDTYLLFLESPANSEVVTNELVRLVFSATESGFLDNRPERTIIEQAGALIPASMPRN
jgi:hypothetical protein